MDDVFIVHIVDAVEDLVEEDNSEVFLDAALRDNEVKQLAARCELHDEEDMAG